VLSTLVALANSLLMIGMPVLLGIWLARRLKVEWRVYGLGMVTFVASQVLHIPFNQWLLSPVMQRLGLEPAAGNAALALVAVLLGLSAGVFEESARLLMLRGPLREARSWSEGLMFGAGHGAIEAILLGLLSLNAYVQLVALRNVDLATVLDPARVEGVSAALTTYWSLPWYQHLIPALERAFALGLHVGLSILVLQAFVRRNYLWFVLAVLWHAAVDALGVFALSTWGVYVTEALIGVAALVSAALVLRLRPGEESLPAAAAVDSPPLPPRAPAPAAMDASRQPNLDLDPETLERSRYQSGS